MNILQMAAVAALFLAFKRRGHSLGPYYSLDTVTASITAANANILEQYNPPPEIRRNAAALVHYTLNPINKLLPEPMYINSWYRSPELNEIIPGASSTSTHMTGGTVDAKAIINGQKDNAAIIRAALLSNAVFDRILLEGPNITAPNWVHIEYNPERAPNDQRHQILHLPNFSDARLLDQDEIVTLFL